MVTKDSSIYKHKKYTSKKDVLKELEPNIAVSETQQKNATNNPKSIEEETISKIVDFSIKNLPQSPGVYLMKDSQENIIYIGKAKNLRERVKGYFNNSDTRINVRYLLQKLAKIETIITANEYMALLVESDLIKKHQPRYNIKLKDDKTQLMLKVNYNQDWPRLELVRKVLDDGAEYFGPFVLGFELRVIFDTVKQIFPLRTCEDKVLHNRVRPCLEYQIKRCLGPCCLEVDKKFYLELLEQAISVVQGKSSEVIDNLTKKMLKASDELRFEDAQEIKDKLEILNRVYSSDSTLTLPEGSTDVFAFYREADKGEATVMFIRYGRIAGAKTFGFEELSIPNDEFFSSLVSEFYQDNPLPDEILLPIQVDDKELREEIFSQKKGSSLKISVPKIGSKYRLLNLAEENSKSNFVIRFGSNQTTGAIEQLMKELELPQLPRTIECIDISHFQGGETVAAITHFKDGKPDKSRYRLFILSEQKNDDFAAMREILTRHLSRSAEENTLPDLIVIDGGKAQLSQGMTVRKELGLNNRPFLIGLAKKRNISEHYRSLQGEVNLSKKPERVFIEDLEAVVFLKTNSAALMLLERIRNETHRFVITFHRKKRQKKLFQTRLDEVPGLSKSTKVGLLKAFGSVKKVAQATKEELINEGGLSEKIAAKILRYLEKSPK